MLALPLGFALVASALAGVPVVPGSGNNFTTFVAPGQGPAFQTATGGGFSNGTLNNSALVPGIAFDRFVQIFLENTNYQDCLANPTFLRLAQEGILFSDYHGVLHPSQPNYIAAVGGSYFTTVTDDSAAYSQPLINEPTIVDLLEARNISWASYSENLPFVGYKGVDFSSKNYVNEGAKDYAYYVRRHVGLAGYSTVVDNPERLARLRNFNNFADDLTHGTLPQWMFIAPNIVNDAHDTTTEYTAGWLEYWLAPLLLDSRFNTPRTLVILSFDESDITATNHIYTAALGGAIPAHFVNTTESLYHTHYSALATVEANWGLGSLKQGDASANVYGFVAAQTNSTNSQTNPVPVPLPDAVDTLRL